MGNQSKTVKKKAEAGDHPEAKKHVSSRVPDQNSSKAIANEHGDARTGQDKDGNEELARGKTRQHSEKRGRK